MPRGRYFVLNNNGSRDSTSEAREKADRHPLEGGIGPAFVDLSSGAPHGAAQPPPLLSARQVAAHLGHRLFAVVHARSVFVRDAPKREGAVLGTRPPGAELVVAEEFRGWVRLSPADPFMLSSHLEPGARAEARASPRAHEDAPAGWLLISGEELGLGRLLQELASDGGGVGGPPRARFEPAVAAANSPSPSPRPALVSVVSTGGAHVQRASDGDTVDSGSDSEAQFDWDVC